MSGSLILILGDHLSLTISSLKQGDQARDVVLMAEVMEEASYVPHHKKKIAFVFSAMRHFAEELRTAGWTVDYVKLDDPANTGALTGEVARAKQRHGLDQVVATEPGEWRLLEAMRGWPNITLRDDDRFLADRLVELGQAAAGPELTLELFVAVAHAAQAEDLAEDDGPAD